jgi:hypothetical protein
MVELERRNHQRHQFVQKNLKTMSIEKEKGQKCKVFS